MAMIESSHLAVPAITVCICTRNRVKYLGPTIAAVLSQEIPNGQFDVLVVDNGSTDGTAEMVTERFGSNTCATVRYVREDRAGLSRARNRGIAETTGDIIAFLDDDAIPEPGWLASIANAFASVPNAAVVGGKVVPMYEGGGAEWLTARVMGIFAPQIPGSGLRRTHHPIYPFGANIAFRKTVFNRIGSFREDLGYCGSDLVPGEETELLMRLEKSGEIILYEPLAAVRHIIPQNRLSKKYLRRRFKAAGLGHYEVEKTRRNDFEYWGFREISERFFRSLRTYISLWRQVLVARLGGSADGFDDELQLLTKLGQSETQLKESLEQLARRLGRK